MSISIATLMLTFITVILAREEENSDASRFLHLFSSDEPQENKGYIEYCRRTNLWRGYLGYVNVFAFLDPSWNYSYRQAIMLELLRKRLEKSGFRDVLFFVVTPPSSLTEDDAENNIEIKAWKEISKNMPESEYFWDVEETRFIDLAKNNGESIILLRDTPELGIWENFHASKNEVVVLDRCGKLTYQVIVPWSILYFPYVKAAILSTYKDNPCGPCDEQSPLAHDLTDYEEYIIRNVSPDGDEVDRNSDFQTEQINATVESQSITVSSKEIKEIEDDKIIQGQTQIASAISDFETTEEYKDALDFTSNEPTSTNDDNLPLTVLNVDTDMISNHENHQSVMDGSLKNIKEKEEISSVDHKILFEDTEDKEILSQKDENLPLRIILYAPHLHQEGQQLKQYTHLILKTGSPDYHEHFHSMSKIYNQQPITLEKSTIALENRKLNDYMNSADESPGIHGEIYDYWRTTEENEFVDKNQNTEFLDYDDTVVENTESKINSIFDNESTILEPSDIGSEDTDSKAEDDLDDLTQRKLTEHYNKLVSWIYYIF